jgi:hypothetical protein
METEKTAADWRERLEREGGDMAFFTPLDAGVFKASIQASRTHYSTPRENLAHGTDYTAFEIAIFEDRKWVSPRIDERFSGKAWAQEFEEGGRPVAGYVPTDTIAQILADLSAATGRAA